MKFKVLIIDDHEPSRDGLIRLIKASWQIPEYGLDIVGVETLVDGLREADTANVTVLDLELPDSDSANTRKNISKFRHPVIVLTGDEDPLVTADCIANGADHVFVKGCLIGFVPSFFEALQKDFVQRVEHRHAA